MNILYLLKTLGTNKLSELVAAIDLPPIDMNLAIWEAIENNAIEIDEEKDRVKVLKDQIAPYQNPELATKLMKVIQHYAKNQSNITKGRLGSYMKDPVTGRGYLLHEYLMTLQYLIDSGQVVEDVISVPEIKDKRPFHKFVFLGLPENEENAEWNARAVNKWIDDFANSKVK